MTDRPEQDQPDSPTESPTEIIAEQPTAVQPAVEQTMVEQPAEPATTTPEKAS